MMVLLFHVERSTAYGWESDTHSQSQAEDGVYAKLQRNWIRGPSGVGISTWKRENTALAKAEIITALPRFTARMGSAATEYRPNWLAIRAAIEAWKAANKPTEHLPLLAETQQFSLAQAGPGAWPTVGQGVAQAGPGGWPSLGHTVVEGSDLTVVSESPTGGAAGHSPTAPRSASCIAVAEAIDAGLGRPLPPGDPIPGEVAAIGDRLGIPTRALCMWIQSWFAEKRQARYEITSPRLVVKAAATNLIQWAKANAGIINNAGLEERQQAASTAGSVCQMPAPPAICEVCAGSGLTNRTTWSTVPELRAAIDAGAQLCLCEAGMMAQSLAAIDTEEGERHAKDGTRDR